MAWQVKKTTTVGVIIPDISNMYYSELARGLEDIAKMYKYQTIISNSDNDAVKEQEIFNNLLSKQVDGIIFLGAHCLKTADMIRKSSVPVVLSGTLDQDESLPSVNIDYVEASREITHKFIESGVQRFAFVGGGYSEKAQIDVLSGIKSLLEEHAMELPESAQYIGTEQYLDGEGISSD